MVNNSRRPELIPRARLKQRSPNHHRQSEYIERPVRHSVSCRSTRLNRPDIERTKSDSSQYPRAAYPEEKRKINDEIERRYVAYVSSGESETYGYCTLKRSEHTIDNNRNKSEESDMDYYTSSESGSQETVKYNENKHKPNDGDNLDEEQHDSNESGFDERRDSSSSQEQVDKDLSTSKIIAENNNSITTIYETVQETTTTKLINEENIIEMNGTNGKLEELEDEEAEISKAEEKEIIKDEIKEKEEEVKDIPEKKSTIAMKLQEIKEALIKQTEKRESMTKIYDSTQNVANSEQTFYEEEYSYEPELKRSSSKIVMRTRSLLNLEEEQSHNNTNFVRPTAVRNKITTGPDGTFVIAGRKANSELNLTDESNNNSNLSSPKSCRLVSGEELKKRKEEIFKTKEVEKPVADGKKYNEEINKNNIQTTKEKAIDNLKKYLKEKKIGLKELLTNNNVVIIEPFRQQTSTEDISEYNHRNVDFKKGCRVTGATIKPSSLGDLPASESNTLPRAAKPHQPHVQRHYFYHLIKTKPDLKEDELPDPDKVRHTRQMFQKVVKVGRKEDTGIMLPIAAKIVNPSKETKPRITPEVRIIDDGFIKKKPLNEIKNDFKKCINKKWTDSGSLSSGVSSDMSCFDNELDNNLDEISQKGYSSDEDAEQDLYQENEVHPVSPEVMQKIRACGTTVTYYGGRVISHSHGPVRSPMTMTIMDEIRQGHEGNRKSSREQYMGVKFRLIKSNSCGSRLELAGTDDATNPHTQSEPSKNRFYEDMYGKSLGEELAECRGRMETIKDDVEEKEEQINIAKVQAVFEQKITKDEKKPVQSWRALIESRKQSRAKELRRPCNDMEFEEFQVAE